jgi:hypothetical protein
LTFSFAESAQQIPATYILTVDPGKKPEDDNFFPLAERAKGRGWPVIQLSSDHNPQWSKPEELVALLDKNR